MASVFPDTIEGWRERAARDPARLAGEWVATVQALPASVRKAVFSWLPAEEKLARALQGSVETEGPLAGVPFAVKDLFDVAGVPTTASSTFLAQVRATPMTDSALVLDLRQAGAVVAAKTHLNEFAYGLSGENVHFGDCPHPTLQGRLSGGSSSGSAWMVGAGLVPLALGTDTGGSIRVPAAYCGLYGIRFTPEIGWSREGCFPLAPGFDTAGWMTASAEDMAASLRALLPVHGLGARSPRGVVLADWEEDVMHRLSGPLERAAGRLGAERSESLVRSFQSAANGAARHYSILQSAEALDVHRDWVDARSAQYDPATWSRIERAQHWSAAQREEAAACRARIKAFFSELWRSYDFAVLPASFSPAPRKHQLDEAFRHRLLGLTAPGSLAAVPILTLPVALGQGETGGLQVLLRSSEAALSLELLRRWGAAV